MKNPERIHDTHIDYSPDASGPSPRPWPYVSVEGIGMLSEARSSRAYALARRWSPVIAPLLHGAGFLAVAAALAGRGFGQTPHGENVGSLATLFLVYLVGGIIFGFGLRFAPSDALWLSVLLAGTAAYATALVMLLFGGIAAGIFVAVLVLCALAYVRTHLRRVASGTVAITTLRGKYSRTLHPGRNLCLPGERITVTLETGPRQFTAPTQSVEVRSATGIAYSAQAAATVSYRILPAEAHKALIAGERWERDLHNLIVCALRDTLQKWSAQMLATGAPPPSGALARTLLAELRAAAGNWGVWIASVRVRNAQLDVVVRDGDTRHSQPVVGVQASRPSGQYASMPPVSYVTPAPSASQPVYASQPANAPHPSFPPAYQGLDNSVVDLALAGFEVSAPAANLSRGLVAGATGSSVAAELSASATPSSLPLGAANLPAEPRHYDSFSAETLADSYEAIRMRRITDPGTIRAVASAFSRVAQDPAQSDEVPFDAIAASQILQSYAQRLEQQHALPATAR